MMNEKAPADEMGIGGGAKGNMVPLPLDFLPGSFDVLCGRGKKNYNSLGNQRLRRIVDSYVEQYSAATSRQDKSDILSAIVNEVRQASPHGGFIKQEPNSERWFEVGDFLAREKVSQAFRDALSFQYRSSKKFKHEKRRQRDKAAKLAKQKGEGNEEEEESKAPSKSPPTKGEPLLKRQSLSVLREEPLSSSGTLMVPPGQGNVQPSRSARAMPTGHGPPPSLLQGPQQQPSGSPFFPFHGQAMLPHQDPSSLVTRHTSWPQMFSSANQPFNHLHAAGVGPQNMAMAHRRFSDAMMTDVNQHPFHQFHHSDPNPQSWSQQLLDQGGMPQSEVAALHASYPGALNNHPGSANMPSTSNSMVAPGPPGSHSSTLSNPTASTTTQSRRERKGPLERSSSNVSTSSATAIVAHLESSLTDLGQDENPFEPVPLPGQSGDGETSGEEKDDEGSILPNW